MKRMDTCNDPVEEKIVDMKNYFSVPYAHFLWDRPVAIGT